MKTPFDTEDLEKEIELYSEECYGFEKVHIENLINPFIKKWVKSHMPHLIDTDENDGQRLRVNVYVNELKTTLKERQRLKAEVEKVLDGFNFEREMGVFLGGNINKGIREKLKKRLFG